MVEPTCPFCKSSRVTWKRLAKVWECLECEQRFGLTEQLQEIDERILRHYPTPIAAAWNLTLDGVQSPASRLMNLFATFQQSLRLPALLMLSQYLDSDIVVGNMAGAIRRFKAPTIGHWQNLVGALCKHRRTLFSLESFSPDLVEAMAKVHKGSTTGADGGGHLLDFIRNARNEWSHGNVLSDQEAARRLPTLTTKMRELLRLLEPLEGLELYMLGTGPKGMSYHARSANPREVLTDQLPPCLRDKFANDESVFLNQNGRVQRLYPLLLPNFESGTVSLATLIHRGPVRFE